MYKYTKYKQHIDIAVQQNALNKTHPRSCAKLVHRSLYDAHATRASHSVRSQGANSVQIVSSFNLHFSSADRVEFRNCERCSVKIFCTMLKVLSVAAFKFGIVTSAFASASVRRSRTFSDPRKIGLEGNLVCVGILRLLRRCPGFSRRGALRRAVEKLAFND